MISASAHNRAENVAVHSVVIPDLKLGDIMRHIFGRHFVERADHAAFKDRSKSSNSIRVDCANHVLVLLVFHRNARVFVQSVVHSAFAGRQQANLIGNHLAHERLSVLRRDAFQHSRNHVALALHGTNDWRVLPEPLPPVLP
jgi:hypothetical protein